ncbi:acyltransferase family protein [Glaciibacter psychrotolerans]|uniref:Peptidoglycan/LPS O-acetylase OafA/YrhL n=1 Tax=Glaciibacter psychrotolerans TaxID=670054 RepID=A0A7Z0EH52_9MICO|nr:acyltransferase family protein [Leifsonia psychrotolerans]NYJ21582.1 peptidoglycan/LPS O-acetylase OafA/YrhL [Leifsonia psychrotolerans]
MTQLDSPAPSFSGTPVGVSAEAPLRTASSRLAGLDGLRALAVTGVLLYHFFPNALPGGFIGVDVFFVISGFLITGLLVSERARSGRISLPQFWRRRLRRLVPPLIPVLLVCSSAAWLIGGDLLVTLGRQLVGALTFSYNWVSIASSSSYFSADEPELFRNLWSLAVEEQFYLVWPLLLVALLLIRRPRIRLTLVLLLAAASAVWMGILFEPGTDPTRVYFGSDTHSFGLAIGAALALILQRPADPTAELPRLRPWLGLGAVIALVGLSIWMPSESAFTYRGGLAIVALLTALVIWASVRPGRFGTRLDSAPLRYLGTRSYSIYLWHWPILVLLQLVWPTHGATEDLARVILVGVLAAVVTLLAAEGSYRWVEQPVRRFGFRGALRQLAARRHLSRVDRQIVIGSLLVAVLFCAGTGAALLTAPSLTSAQAAIARGEAAMKAAAASAAEAAQRADSVTIPLRAHDATVLPAGERMTAVGDSVMLASAPELQAAFPGIVIDAAVSRGMGAAPDIIDSLKQADQLRPIVVVGLGTNGPIDSDDLERIQSTIGPTRQLIVINAFAERHWTQGVNQTLADFSAHSPRIELADWSTAIAPHTDVLADDNIHPGPTGGRIYADCIAEALQRLENLPPAQQPGPNRLLLLP